MATQSARIVVIVGIFCLMTPFTVTAQMQRDIVPLKNWPAPLYWQPNVAEEQASRALLRIFDDRLANSVSDITPKATTPVGALVFVAMTPCRLVDTRTGLGFIGAFGPPSLVGAASRTFPIQSSTTCSIPSIAQAYSFNITVVPAGATFPGNVNPSGALGYLTIWPTGIPQPNVSTLNSFLGTVAANAAIVPAGIGGSVDVFVSNSTDLIIDINGYYAPQTGITLAQGTPAAPSMSFSGDPGTGIFSSGAGTLNISTGGADRLRVDSSGDVGVGTSAPHSTLDVVSSTTQIRFGNTNNDEGGYLISASPTQALISGGAKWNGSAWIARSTAASLIDNSNGNINFYTGSGLTPGLAFSPSQTMQIQSNGNVGIGTSAPDRQLTVQRAAGGAYINVRSNDFLVGGPHEVLLGADATGGILSTMSNDDLQLRAGGNSTKMVIKAGGNVGIGTLTPSSALSVNGSADFSGNVRFGTGINNSGQGFKHVRIPVHMEPNSGSNSQYFWGTPFADANYSVSATIEDVSQGLCAATLDRIGHKTAGAVYVSLSNNFISPCDIIIHLIGIHD